MTRILVIEDNDIHREVISDVLTVEGYEVVTAANGQAGLHAAQQGHVPDLIICDIVMPDLDGYAVLKLLRQHSKTATTPFIFLTARNEREDMRRGMNLGANDFIGKPFAPEELILAVKSRLKHREAVIEQYEETLTVLRRNIIYALPHELRTPLTKILGYANVLTDNVAAFSADEVAMMAGTIERAGKRLRRLFENYLAYAQMELIGSDPLFVAELRNHILGDSKGAIESASREQAALHGREDDLAFELVPLAIGISADNLNKIVVELIDNACKFSKPGTRILIASQRQQGEFSFTVRDFGAGMMMEQVEQIGAYMQFDREFFEQQGVGLGLALVRRLVELHGGRLTIKSAPGHGTAATVTLPL